MPTQTVTFSGEVAAAPPGGNPSGQPTVLVSYDERSVAQRQMVTTYTLSSDSPVSIDFGPLSEANMVSIRAVGGKIRVRITSSDGTNQSIPVDPLLLLRCDTVGITAIELTRTPTYDTDVYVVLTENAD